MADQILVKDLFLRTIIGVNDDERSNRQDVLINLRNAIQDKNLTNYLSSFTNNPKNGRHFGFRPDQNARLRFPGTWDNWTIDGEGTYANNAFQSMPADSIPRLTFVGDLLETPLPDSTILISDYELRFPHTRPKEQFPSTARGRLEFRLATTPEGLWAIYFWIDESRDDSPTWSELKALFSE